MNDKIIRKMYLIGILILVSTLFYYQFIKGDYYLRRAKNNYVKVIPLSSIRGSIYDRNSTLLAYDKASFNIAVIPYQIRKEKNVLFNKLAKSLNCDVNLIDKNYKKNLQTIFSPVNIIFDTDKTTALQLKEEFGSDIVINPQPKRFYPYPYETAHLLGYVKEAKSFYESLKKYGYTPSERVGFLGLEQYYDTYLKGEDGGDLIEVDATGSIAGFLGQKKAQGGNDIYLTIDNRMQQAAYDAFKEKRGSLIFMDANDGEILSLVSLPSFNPNQFIKGDDLDQIFKSKKNPLFNRAIQTTYPLGSTFKPILGLASLEEGKIKPSTTFNCIGKKEIGEASFHCWSTHGNQNLYQALAHSCNVYFYNLGLILDHKNMEKWARKFHLDALSGIDLPYERIGKLPSTVRNKKRWYAGDTLNLSIGQGSMESSPLEILLGINVFSNGGYLVKPYLLKKISNLDSRLSEKNYLNFSTSNLNIIKKGMIDVVEAENGTAKILKKLELKIAGKTGTAQNRGPSHGWFVGFFPHTNPKYSICVFVENGGSSHEALKIVYRFLENLKENNLL